MGRTAMKWLLALIMTWAIGVGIWSQVPKEEKRSLPRSIANIGQNENVGLLRQLNAEWTMPDGYTLEEIEVDGIAMEWVQAKGEKPDKAVLRLHGGAYNRSLAVNGTTYRRAAVKYAEIQRQKRNDDAEKRQPHPDRLRQPVGKQERHYRAPSLTCESAASALMSGFDPTSQCRRSCQRGPDRLSIWQ